MKFKLNIFLTIPTLFALTLTSCGSSKNNSIIATSVALTVQAQNTQPIPATDTPEPVSTETPLGGTPAVTPTISTPTSHPTSSGGPLNCSIVANFVSENIPDGTIESPGAVFIKTWNVQNNGTCIWDTSWKIAYDSGDLLGGGYVYNFPQIVAPGQTVPISLQLTAPLAEGKYTGYWLLEPPSGPPFGVGQSGNAPLSVTINVNSGTPGKGTPTVYGITSITYAYGTSNTHNSNVPGVNAGYCTSGANIFLTTWATVSASGPLTIQYRWRQSDGASGGGLHTLIFTEAGTQTVKDADWPLGNGHEIGLVWDEIEVTSPVKNTYTNTTARYDHECK
jgi:hypothetical protein